MISSLSSGLNSTHSSKLNSLVSPTNEEGSFFELEEEVPPIKFPTDSTIFKMKEIWLAALCAFSLFSIYSL